MSDSALVVVDVQEGVMASAWKRDAVIARIGLLVARARREGVPVVWIQHQDEELRPGTPPWRIVAELSPADGEPVVAKEYRSAFEGTSLEELLAERGVGRLVVCGAQSDFCVRHTVHAAQERGYDVVLVADAHTTEDTEQDGVVIPAAVIVAHQNRVTRGYGLPGRATDLATHDRVRLG